MAYWILKVILSPLLRCLYRVDVEGRDNIPRHGPLIVASNHQSFIDSIFIPLLVPRRVTFVAKAEYFERRRTAWFFRACGQIPIKRGGGSASDRALASARDVLSAGGVLGIYPEGTRSPDGRLYKGHTGIARLLLATGATVVPMALSGTAAVQPIDSLYPRPFRRVGVRFGPPMTWPAGDADDSATLRRITDEVMDAIGGLSGQERVADYAKRLRVDRGASSGEPVRTIPGPAAVAGRSAPPGSGPVEASVDVTDGVRTAALAGAPGPDERRGPRPSAP